MDLPQAFGELPLRDLSLMEPTRESNSDDINSISISPSAEIGMNYPMEPEGMSAIQSSEVTATLPNIEKDELTEGIAIKQEDGVSSTTIEISLPNELIYLASEAPVNDSSDSVSEFE
jgi:hypothetical protein